MSHDREKTIFHLSHESTIYSYTGHECSHYILSRLFMVRVNERIFFFFCILCIYSVHFSKGEIFRTYKMSLHVIFCSKISIFGISFLNFSLLTVSFLLEFLVARAFNLYVRKRQAETIKSTTHNCFYSSVAGFCLEKQIQIIEKYWV